MTWTADKRYGRGGGRWSNADEEAGVDALQRARVKEIERWPWGNPDPDCGWGLSWWLATADRADRRRRTGQVLSAVDHRAARVRDAYRKSKRFKTGADHHRQDVA